MQKLIFVYNANSGIGNTILDVAHKLFSPKTYNCNLCAITFNTFSENNVWKAFRKETNIEMTFFHTDEFEAEFNFINTSYPVILAEENDELDVFLSAEEINTLHSPEALITVLKTKLRLAPH